MQSFQVVSCLHTQAQWRADVQQYQSRVQQAEVQRYQYMHADTATYMVYCCSLVLFLSLSLSLSRVS